MTNKLDGTYFVNTLGALERVGISTGFFVSVEGFESKVMIEACSESFLRAMKDVYSSLARINGKLVGIWTDNKQVYFDLTEHIQDRKEAILAGKRRNQKAIWDVANSEAIDLSTYPFLVNGGFASKETSGSTHLTHGEALYMKHNQVTRDKIPASFYANQPKE